MQLESDQTYVTRDGKRTVSVRYDPESIGDNHPFVSSCGYQRYTPDGKLFADSECDGDLVSLKS